MIWILVVAVVVAVLAVVGVADLRRRGRTGSSDLTSDPHQHDPRVSGEGQSLGQLGGQGWVPMSKDDGHPRDEDRR